LLSRMYVHKFVDIHEVVRECTSICWFVSKVHRDIRGVKSGLDIALANAYAQVGGYT